MIRYWTADAVLAPILETYDRIAGAADSSPARTAWPGRPPQNPPSGPAPATVGPDGSISGYIRGRANPRRSEDFSQRIRLGPNLLAREGVLRGRIAHVLGNGPSLARADIAGLGSDCVIGVNAAVLLEEKLGRPLDYYCVSDRRFLAAQEGREMAASARGAARVFAGYCEGFLDDDDIHYVRILAGDSASDDVRHGLHHGCSVALFAGQLAAWLGAREVRLHGMECDYSAGRFDNARERPPRRNDPGIYVRVARSAAALAALLTRRGASLTVAGPSRLTGSFGSRPVPGITALPVAGAP
jgi:hypothetical protein